ncbi:unnamed protein product [Candida verbasci]|uniref:CFEM domain-containing protein n=1 Tax=Candida verbasci TaxID=1227364 RepID=A0A9W4XMS0_9ASCO|nr:unnamed protein product [Candida verbasci]
MSNPYETYPSVPRTASINGFADRIYDQLPACAQPCVKESTSSTPCPYWDTGCLCVIPAFTSAVGECIAENCSGEDVTNAESLAVSICSSAGVWEPYWILPASVSQELSDAANRQVATSTASTEQQTTQELATTSAPAETTAQETSVAQESSAPQETSVAEESSAPQETSVAEESSAPQETSVAEESSAPQETSVAQESSAQETSSVEGSSSAAQGESTESESVSVALVNAANAPTIAFGGIVACLAALF